MYNIIKIKVEKMESFEEMFEESLKTLKANTAVEGEIIALSDDEIFVNLGYKADGIIAKNEISYDENYNIKSNHKIGDKITVYVLKLNDGRGNVELSLKKLESEKNKIDFDEAVKNNEVIQGTVIKVLDKGIRVSAKGIIVFIPKTQLSNSNMEEYANKNISFRVITNERNRIIGSEKSVSREVRSKAIEEAFSKINVGDIVKGTVKKINEYGAFIDIGGVEGLLHVSQMTWERNVNAHDFVQIGQELEVKIIDIDREKGRIALQYKKEQDNPWLKIGSEIKEGDVVNATVQKLLAFGAFVEIIPGIDGFIHIAQISYNRINQPSDVLKVGQEIQAKIVKIDNENKKIELSIKALLEPEVKEENTDSEIEIKDVVVEDKKDEVE